MTQSSTIYVVDDDPAVSRAMVSVGHLLDLPVLSFPSAEDFLRTYRSSHSGCLVLDIKMPGMTGLELQRKLTTLESTLPIVMISGHADVRIAVDAMSHGAITLLEKPFRLDEITEYIRKALSLDSERRAKAAKQRESTTRLAGLTAKEREVFDLIADGTDLDPAMVRDQQARQMVDQRNRQKDGADRH